METMYPITGTIELVLLGGLFGTLGQAVRETLGLVQMRLNPEVAFNLSRLITNLSIGFIAGSLGISLLATSAVYEIRHRDIFMLLVLGYAAGDFIERIIKAFVYKGRGGERATKASTDSMSNTETNDT